MVDLLKEGSTVNACLYYELSVSHSFSEMYGYCICVKLFLKCLELRDA